ncbi:hypothetical protein [Streptomyces sp. NBC_01092]|uniref:hypothetical protein n=1 Tax=Streptomyces sp. NBC_01092 TaxID=2903748 RepID=UPI00386755F5|nr:hypothetical protein OG254_25335 [Streptomyces sp. NBC_01092]
MATSASAAAAGPQRVTLKFCATGNYDAVLHGKYRGAHGQSFNSTIERPGGGCWNIGVVKNAHIKVSVKGKWRTGPGWFNVGNINFKADRSRTITAYGTTTNPGLGRG